MSLAKSSALEQQGRLNAGAGSRFNGAPCAYFDGMYQYFNAHYK